MATSLLALGEIKDGKLHIIHRDKFTQTIGITKNCKCSIEIKKFYRKRSIQQNKSWWGFAYKLIHEALKDAGWNDITEDETHEYIKKNCLPVEYVERLKSSFKDEIINQKTGEVIKLDFRLTTTEMTTTEGIEYYHNMQEFTRENLGFELPDPGF